MLVQTMNHISQRFQNIAGTGDRDPLANLEIDPLRPLNNLLWGYIQDEQNRLSVDAPRLTSTTTSTASTLHGKAVTGLRTADRRSQVPRVLPQPAATAACSSSGRTTTPRWWRTASRCSTAIKETHYLLAQGAHNQFGDLPSTARQEMLMQQWLLSRPEMREFLGGRVMVPYPEPWMDRVDAMKSLQGWTDISVVHFHDLARLRRAAAAVACATAPGASPNDPAQAANWARYWRPEIQGYIHAYRAVTGVDLTADITDRQALAERYVPPSVHLRNRLAVQQEAVALGTPEPPCSTSPPRSTWVCSTRAATLAPWEQLTSASPAVLRSHRRAPRRRARRGATWWARARAARPVHAAPVLGRVRAWARGRAVCPCFGMRAAIRWRGGGWSGQWRAACPRGAFLIIAGGAAAPACARAPPGRRRAVVVSATAWCPGCGRAAPLVRYLEVLRAHGGLLVLDDTQALGCSARRGPGSPTEPAGGGSLR